MNIADQDHKQIGVMLQGINGCAQWLKAIPDDMILRMNQVQRECVGKFLSEQAERYTPGCIKQLQLDKS